MRLNATDYSVDLDVFQGPLDLLLYLIRKDEVDIYDIPIANITEQYLKYAELLKLMNLENAGEYILMAATLIRIKAQMLLPREGLEADEMDPREELTRALLEYRKFKEASDILGEKREIESHLTCIADRSNGFKKNHTVLEESASLFDLLTAFQNVIKEFGEESSYFVNAQDYSIEDRVEVIENRLRNAEFATLDELFSDIKIKIVAIVTFVAILEMVKSRRISVRQSLPFSEIRVYRGERFDMPADEVEETEESKETINREETQQTSVEI